MYGSVRFSSHLRNDQGRHYRLLYNLHGQMGLLSEQHSFEGSGIRQQLTIWCRSWGTIPRQECFCSVYAMDNFLSDSPIHRLCSLLPLLLHSRSLLVKSAPTCLLFNHAITIRRRHPLFDFLLSSTMAERKKKQKNRSHTLSSKQRTKNITLDNLPLVKDNHKDEQNHQDRRKSNTLF